jgi:hypothetical protein
MFRLRAGIRETLRPSQGRKTSYTIVGNDAVAGADDSRKQKQRVSKSRLEWHHSDRFILNTGVALEYQF